MQHGYWKSGNGDWYGFGMDAIKKKGWKLGGHGGGFSGFRTNTQFDPKKRLVVSVLVNSDSADPKGIGFSIINIIDTFQQDADDTKNDLHKFEGRFYTPEREIMDIVAVGKKLFSICPLWWSEFNQAKELVTKDDFTLKIETAGGFSSPGEDIVYFFDNKGYANKITVAGATMLPYAEAKKLDWTE